MNQYGRRAQTHWQRYLPSQFAEIADPEAFFEEMGSDLASQIHDLADEIAGPDPRNEGYMDKLGPTQPGAAGGGAHGDGRGAAGAGGGSAQRRADEVAPGPVQAGRTALRDGQDAAEMVAVEPATVEPAAPFELAAGRPAGTTAVPTMEHFLGKRPDPATVDEIEINDWRDVARRLGISEDLVHRAGHGG